jgi:hypothetical protein
MVERATTRTAQRAAPPHGLDLGAAADVAVLPEPRCDRAVAAGCTLDALVGARGHAPHNEVRRETPHRLIATQTQKQKKNSARDTNKKKKAAPEAHPGYC